MKESSTMASGRLTCSQSFAQAYLACIEITGGIMKLKGGNMKNVQKVCWRVQRKADEGVIL
ncbi:MAG: hypothetical protein WC568_09945 [Candidatus Methanoperedens sp.]